MEKNYLQYVSQTKSLLTPEGLWENIRRLRPLGHFIKDPEGRWQPLHYPGYTLITPVFPDETVNIKTYCILGDIQQILFRDLNPAKVVPAPLSAFHATIARLISGTDYENRMRNGRNGEFLNEMAAVLSDIPVLKPVKMEFRGVSVSPNGVIMALLDPATEDDYQRLIALRKYIYANKPLQNLGVEPKRLFLGHVTLAYIEDVFNWEDQKTLMELLTALNERFFQSPPPFEITRAEVRRFENYLSFVREDNWPCYQFADVLRF